MPEKLRMNLEYAQRRTAVSDLEVMARTVFVLFSSASSEGESP